MIAVIPDPRRWPMTLKAPAVVVVFMVAVSVVITQVVLARLKETREQHLATLSSTVLEGLASAVLPYVLREDIWEIFDAIDRSAALGGGFGRAFIVITSADGRTLAASNPSQVPLDTPLADWDDRFKPNQTLVIDEAEGKAHARKLLRHQGRDIGRIFADFEIGHLIAERREVLRTLVLTNLFLMLCLAGLAYWIIRRMLSPLAQLSRHIDRGTAGVLEPIPLAESGHPDSEFARLFRRYNTLIEAVAEREELTKQLAAEERMASLGRLASGIAHEINNPLGGLFNAIDTLKTHGEKPAVRHASLDLIERGLRDVRDIVRTVLAIYRADHQQRGLTAVDLDDTQLLVRREIDRKNVTLEWHNTISGDVPLPAATLRQILLNLVLNAVAAAPNGGKATVRIGLDSRHFSMNVEDSGKGLAPGAAELLTGQTPRPASHGGGGGLGLWVSRRMVGELGGECIVGRSALGGASIFVRVPIPAEGSPRHVA
jgi:signal transduction histidine kinase